MLDLLDRSWGTQPQRKKVPGSNPPSGYGFSVWSLHVLPASAWVRSRYFFQPSKDMQIVEVRWTGDSKLAVGVDVYVLALSKMPISSYGSWDRLQLALTLNWMDDAGQRLWFWIRQGQNYCTGTDGLHLIYNSQNNNLKQTTADYHAFVFVETNRKKMQLQLKSDSSPRFSCLTSRYHPEITGIDDECFSDTPFSDLKILSAVCKKALWLEQDWSR